MKIDEIKMQMLNYDCKDIKCLICGNKPKDSEFWRLHHESYSLRYNCQCRLFSVYYEFHKTTNTRADYDIGGPECSECGSENFGIIEETISGGDVERELICNECEYKWLEFYKFGGVNLFVDGGLLSSNVVRNDVLFLPFPDLASSINKKLKNI